MTVRQIAEVLNQWGAKTSGPFKGLIVTWDPEKYRRVKKLPKYLKKSGQWQLIAQLQAINDDLIFSQNDIEGAMMARFPSETPEHCIKNAKRLWILLGSWRYMMKCGSPQVPPKMLQRMKHISDPGRKLMEAFKNMLESDDEEGSCAVCDDADEKEASKMGCYPNNLPQPPQKRVKFAGILKSTIPSRMVPQEEDVIDDEEVEEDELEQEEEEEAEEEEDETNMEAPNKEYIMTKDQWAIRTFDEKAAHATHVNKCGKLIFTWEDGDIWNSGVTAPAPIEKKKVKLPSPAVKVGTEEQMSKEQLSEARQAYCKQIGQEWKTNVQARPKFSGGGWEVVVRHNSNQVWSKPSNAKQKCGDGSLKATIESANRIMHEKKLEADSAQKRNAKENAAAAGAKATNTTPSPKAKGKKRKLMEPPQARPSTPSQQSPSQQSPGAKSSRLVTKTTVPKEEKKGTDAD